MAAAPPSRMPRSLPNFPRDVTTPSTAGVDAGNRSVLWVSPPACLLRLHDHLGLHRIGDEAGVVGLIVEHPELVRGRDLLPDESALGQQRDSGDGEPPRSVLLQDADRLVPVAV